MLKAIYEGELNATFTVNAEATAGIVVDIDSANANSVKVSAGLNPVGVLSQDVKTFADGAYRSLVDLVAGVGEKAGVYRNGGHYTTDQYVAGTYTPGSSLYVTNVGTLTHTLDTQTTPAPTSTTGTVKVGVVVSEGDGVLEYLLTI